MANIVGPEIVDNEEDGIVIDIASMTSEENAVSVTGDTVEHKKRGRPRKSTTKTAPDGSTIITSDDTHVEPLGMPQSTEPYINTYSETTGLLRGAIMELESLGKDVKAELDAVKSSKTMRNKYTHVNNLADTAANIINSKINAVKEINSIISKANDLDMKRYKDNKAAMIAENQNSDQRIFDMYNAFVNTPVGAYNPMSFPTMQEMTMAGGMESGIITSDINSGYSSDPAYAAYKQRETPEQKMMVMQKNNPNVKTVVVYNQSNQTKRFEVRDTTTGQVIPGAPVPADFLLADTTVNIQNGVARNANIDTVYPLVLEGAPDSLMNY